MAGTMNTAAAVNDTGLQLLYQPSFEPVADIVFVHGLQGHPRRTWTKQLNSPSGPNPPSAACNQPKSQLRFWKRDRRAFSQDTSLSSSSSRLRADEHPAHPSRRPPNQVFWPQDLLPHDRPDVRILTWGYDTVVTRGWQPANKNNLFAHARDLLYALERARPPQRPLVFVAHSLGGIMVKEVLRRSETSREQSIQDIISSTAAVVFLGTPHRGSPGLANLGEIVRRTASTLLRVDSNATILRTLGCDSPELELCRESFTAQWREYQFRVKTFQEAFGLGGIGVGRYSEKVVPDTSSLLDDAREHAETIGANHMDMVRFFGEADPGYQKVAGELRIIVDRLYRSQQDPLQPLPPVANSTLRPPKEWTLSSDQIHGHQPQQLSRPHQVPTQSCAPSNPNAVPRSGAIGSRPSSPPQTPAQPPAEPTPELSDLEKECLQYLSFEQLGARQDNIQPELEGTCQWISQHPAYLEWEARHEVVTHHGMIWIKGKAGAGKSVIMKKILLSTQDRKLPGSIVASFFFNARGAELERNIMGMYRSLLHQALQQDDGVRQNFLKYYLNRKQTRRLWDLREIDLQEFISSFLSQRMDKPIYLFIDALDECKEDEVRAVVNYLRELTDLAYSAGNHMSVCVSSRRYPNISVARCPTIDMEDGNRSDVSKYVRQKILSHADGSVPESLAISVDNKASHVFLWAVLVVEMLLREWDNGTSLRELEAMLHRIPQEIEQLFDGLANTLTSQERPEAVRLFQWVLFSQKPLSLGSLQYGIVFGVEQPPPSFAAVHEREGRFESHQFTRRITHYSRGLIEVLKRPGSESDCIVQVIHESVRDWLFNNGGFVRLDATLSPCPTVKSHIQIARTCLNILQTSDFLEMHPRQANVPLETSRRDWGRLKGTYWHSDQVHAGQGLNLSKEKEVLGITRYCADYIFMHARIVEREGAVPTVVLTSLSKLQSTSWANLREAVTEDPELCVHPSTHSLLTLLCRKGFVTSVTWLLENSENHQARGIHCNTIRAAISGYHLTTLEALDNHHPLCSITDENGRNAFHFVCEILALSQQPFLTMSEKIIKFLLQRGCDVNAKDNTGMTGVMIVVDNNGYALLDVLLESGAYIDAQDDRQRTALHRAVEKNNWLAFTRLLEMNASLVAQDNDGQIPLHKAAALNHLHLVELLLARPSSLSSLNVKDATGSTPLHLAALSGAGKIVCKLVLVGADANSPDEIGQTPLHIAARKISYETLEIMLDNGADLMAKDRFGMTAADHAESVAREQEIIELLDPGTRYN